MDWRPRCSRALGRLCGRFPGGLSIALFGVCVTALAWLYVWQTTSRELELELQRVNGENNALARTFEEHVARALNTADNALLFLKREYERHGGTTERMVNFIDEARRDPLLNQAGLVDRAGDLVLSAVPHGKPINIAHREHFQVHAANAAAGLFVAKPVVNQVAGAWSIFLSRRLNGPDGSFDGIVTAGMDPQYFSDFFAAPELGIGRTILLVGQDGIVRARRFQQQADVGQDIGSSPLFTLIRNATAGSCEVVSPIDGQPKLASYRTVRGSPLIVVVSELRETALAGFTERKRRSYFSTLCFTLFTAACCAALIRSARITGRQNVRLLEELAERERAEGRLRLFFEAVEQALDGVQIIDPQGRVLFSNKAVERIYGFTPEELRGMNVNEMNVDPEFAGQVILPSLRDQGRWSGEILVRHKDGHQFPIWLSASMIVGGAGEPLAGIGIIRDITEKQKMEEQLRNAQKLESVGVLAGGIAHDFNNLLCGILGNISLARMALPADEQALALLQGAEEACQHATELSGRLLTFAKGGEPCKRTMQLEKALRDSIGFALSGSNVSALVSVEEALRPVDADEGQLRQVFNNLSINANEAMPGGGTLEVRAENLSVAAGAVPGLREGDYVTIAFRDSGAGIPPSIVGRIFDPYFSTKGLGNRKGQGLGLTICHSIVKGHDGLIRVDTELGKGTTFTIYLPASRNDVAGTEIAAARTEVKPQTGGKILVMEDDERVRGVLGGMLKHFGHQADLFPDSAGTLRAYQEAQAAGAPYSLVILDLTIQGGKGGVETLSDLKGIDPQVRAIISSGYADDPILDNFREHGFSGAIAKPYTAERLSQALAPLLAAG